MYLAQNELPTSTTQAAGQEGAKATAHINPQNKVPSICEEERKEVQT